MCLVQGCRRSGLIFSGCRHDSRAQHLQSGRHHRRDQPRQARLVPSHLDIVRKFFPGPKFFPGLCAGASAPTSIPHRNLAHDLFVFGRCEALRHAHTVRAAMCRFDMFETFIAACSWPSSASWGLVGEIAATENQTTGSRARTANNECQVRRGCERSLQRSWQALRVKLR
jgi:hypothetical protein